jgi:hypothetical protein
MFDEEDENDAPLSWSKVLKILKEQGFTEAQLLEADRFIRRYYHAQYPPDHVLLRPKRTFLTELKYRAQRQQQHIEPDPPQKTKSKGKQKRLRPTKRKRTLDEEAEISFDDEDDNDEKSEPAKKIVFDDDEEEVGSQPTNNEIAKSVKKRVVYDDDDDENANEQHDMIDEQEESKHAVVFDIKTDGCRMCKVIMFRDLKQCRACKGYYCSSCYEIEFSDSMAWNDIYEDNRWTCFSCNRLRSAR